MTSSQKISIIQLFKEFFREEIIPNHIKNTEKLHEVKAFQSGNNPFLRHYLAKFYGDEVNARNVAKIMILPRSLGTSITTSFGTSIQKFIATQMKGAFGTAVEGCDIEFDDNID